MLNKTAFVTGASGFLGSHIAERLLKLGYKLAVLMRSKASYNSFLSYLRDNDYSLYTKTRPFIRCVIGDLEKAKLGLSVEDLRFLSKETDVVYHSAAVCEFTIPLHKIRRTNVNGSRNVFELCESFFQSNKLESINYVSTVAVAGTHKGRFRENMLCLGQDFNNTYEKSKYEAELLANKYRNIGLPINIFRPSIITGSYKSGRTNNLKMFYQPLHFFSLELFDTIPANYDTKFNFVPVDFAADAIVLIAERIKGAGVGQNFHIVNDQYISFERFLSYASNYFGFSIPKPVTKHEFKTSAQFSEMKHKLLKPYISYFNYELSFDNSNSKKVLGAGFNWPSLDQPFFDRLFKYCEKIDFIRKKRRPESKNEPIESLILVS